jgi:hypothetical protein
VMFLADTTPSPLPAVLQFPIIFYPGSPRRSSGATSLHCSNLHINRRESTILLGVTTPIRHLASRSSSASKLRQSDQRRESPETGGAYKAEASGSGSRNAALS